MQTLNFCAYPKCRNHAQRGSRYCEKHSGRERRFTGRVYGVTLCRECGIAPAEENGLCKHCLINERRAVRARKKAK